MDWQIPAQHLADQAVGPGSSWWDVVAKVPRHLLVPRWWEHNTVVDGATDPDHWLAHAYADQTLVTSLSGVHADHATKDQGPGGSRLPTSSSTAPSLTVRMLRHARIGQDVSVLDVGTGSGYGTALLCHRVGETHVTSIDIDDYIISSARERLERINLRPRILRHDALAPLPGTYDRIVATVAMPGIPKSWMMALRASGRIVTTLRDTSLIITATKYDDGHAYGRVEWDRAAFMDIRHRDDYDHWVSDMFNSIAEDTGQAITQGRYPVIPIRECWELMSYLEVTNPGVQHYYREANNYRTAWMMHPDGSWARARAEGYEAPEVHQSGPRRLWDALDAIREHWIREGELPLFGARVEITPDGKTTFTRRTPSGKPWSTSLP